MKTDRRRPTPPLTRGSTALLNPDDRRDLACLGLMVLVYGLAVAPVLHAVVEHGGGGHHHLAHVHGRSHSHGARGEHAGAGAHAHRHEGTARAHAHRGEDSAHAHRGEDVAQAHRGEDAAQAHRGKDTAQAHRGKDTAHAQGHPHSGRATAPADGAARANHDAPVEPDSRQDGHEHLTGSVEHLQAVALAWAVLKLPRMREVGWLAEARPGPSRVPGAAVRPTAMPQGP